MELNGFFFITFKYKNKTFQAYLFDRQRKLCAHYFKSIKYQLVNVTKKSLASITPQSTKKLKNF